MVKRDHADGKGKKFRGQDIEKKKCPKCPSKRMWVARGEDNPEYKWKCTKCGHKLI